MKNWMKSHWIGALTVSALLLLLLPFAARTAVTDIAGLAVAQSQTLWKNLRDAAAGDGLADGVMASALMMFNGASFDRARGDTTNGLDVDVTRIGGGVTPADAFANPTDAIKTFALPGSYNGTTWDLARGVSAANNTAVTSRGTRYAAPLSTWFVTNSPAAGVRATASIAAGGGTVRHVAQSVTICVHALAAAVGQLSLTAQLRDGATGAGTVMRTWYFSVEVTDESRHIPCVDLAGINMTGSANTAMTLEFVALAANVAQTVTLTGYSTP